MPRALLCLLKLRRDTVAKNDNTLLDYLDELGRKTGGYVKQMHCVDDVLMKAFYEDDDTGNV